MKATFRIATQYARALVEQASSSGQLKQLLSHLQHITYQLSQVPQLKEFLLAPPIDHEIKKKVLKQMFSQKADDSLLHFLFILIDRDRFKYLAAIEEEVRRLVKRKLGIVEVDLITAVPVNQALQDKIKNKMEKFYQKQVEVTSHVDPAIVGGMILKVGHEILDDSIRNRLAKLKDSLCN